MIHRQADPGYWHQAPGELRDMVAIAPGIGMRASIYALDEGPATPIALIVERPPNSTIARHAHPGPRIEIILRGSIDADGLSLGCGDVLTSAAHEFYGPYIVGPEGCTTCELFAGAADLYQPIYDDGRSADFRGDLARSLERAAIARAAATTATGPSKPSQE